MFFLRGCVVCLCLKCEQTLGIQKSLVFVSTFPVPLRPFSSPKCWWSSPIAGPWLCSLSIGGHALCSSVCPSLTLPFSTLLKSNTAWPTFKICVPCKNTSAYLIQCEVSGCEIADVMNMCHRHFLCTSNFWQGTSTLITMPGTQDSTIPCQHMCHPCQCLWTLLPEKKQAHCSLCGFKRSSIHHKVMHGATFPVYEFQKFLTHPFADLRFQRGGDMWG